MVEYFYYILIGLLAGISAGLLGMSGGVITVPCLVLVYHYIGIPPRLIMHLAIGTSLAAMVFSSLSSTYSHSKKKVIWWDVFKGFAVGIVFGAVLGSFIARSLPSKTLQMIFGFFECSVGIYFFWFKKESSKGEHTLPNFAGKSFLGFIISSLSTMLGIGGGFITVPILLQYKVPIKNAVGTSAATSFLITTLGAVSFLIFGWDQHAYKDTIGFLYLPAFITLSIATLFAAPWGVKLAHYLPTVILRRIFSIALFIAGLLMIIS